MISPEVLLIDSQKESRGLIYDRHLRAWLPNLSTSFEVVDALYENKRDNNPEELLGDQFEFSLNGGKPVKASVFKSDQTAKTDEILVILAPFSDGEPQTSGAQIAEYSKLEKPGIKDKQHYQPHSWNQTTKSSTIHDLLDAEGIGMPVLTIYSPIPQNAYAREHLSQFWDGDFSPAAELINEGLRTAQERLHGKDSETQLRRIHFYGASLGASNVIGGASVINAESDDYRVISVTAQELILGPDNLFDLFKRFTIKGSVGAESQLAVPDSIPKILEPEMRRNIDAHGNEVEIYLRMGKGAVQLAYMHGLTNPEPTVSALNLLVDTDVSVTVINAENSSMSHQTFSYLPDHHNLKTMRIRAIAGQKAVHLTNEHVATSSAVALLGLDRSNI